MNKEQWILQCKLYIEQASNRYKIFHKQEDKELKEFLEHSLFLVRGSDNVLRS